MSARSFKLEPGTQDNITVWRSPNGTLTVRLYDTNVFMWNRESGQIVVSLGDYDTSTTRKAINRALQLSNVPAQVVVFKGRSQLVVDNNGVKQTYPFNRGCMLVIDTHSLQVV